MSSPIKYAEVGYVRLFIILPSEKYEKIETTCEIPWDFVENGFNNLKRKFWILTIRQTIKSENRNCQLCKIQFEHF